MAGGELRPAGVPCVFAGRRARAGGDARPYILLNFMHRED